MSSRSFLVLLFGCCQILNPAHADWILLTESERTQVFVEYKDALRGEDPTKIEYLLNFIEPQRIKDLVFSAITEVEFDCERGLMRNLSMANYSEPMGQGVVLFKSKRPTSWRRAPRAGMPEDIWNFVCEKPPEL